MGSRGLARFRRVAAVAALVALAGCARATEPNPGAAADVASLYAPHGEVGAFFNPWWRFPHRITDLLRWPFRKNPYDKSRPPEIPRVANDGASFARRENSAALTWIGHATVAIHDEVDVALTDPNWGKRAFLVRRESEPGVPIDAVPGRAFAVLSHNHYDHLDADTVDRLPDTVSWFVPLGMAEWFRRRGRERVTELDWWQSARHGRWTVTCLPSQHWSRRLWQGTNATLWCSWLLDSGARRYFFAGDSGYFHGFAEFGRRFAPIDVAILPIGAFEPRDFMRYQHMSPEEAYRAFLDLKATYLVPMHWGAFDVSFEPLDLPPKALGEAVRSVGGDPSRVRILAVGERWPLPN